MEDDVDDDRLCLFFSAPTKLNDDADVEVDAFEEMEEMDSLDEELLEDNEAWAARACLIDSDGRFWHHLLLS